MQPQKQKQVQASKVYLTPNDIGVDRIKDWDGKEIGNTGIFVIGDIAYNDEFKRWQCLANVNGMLCIIEVSVYAAAEVKVGKDNHENI